MIIINTDISLWDIKTSFKISVLSPVQGIGGIKLNIEELIEKYKGLKSTYENDSMNTLGYYRVINNAKVSVLDEFIEDLEILKREER